MTIISRIHHWLRGANRLFNHSYNHDDGGVTDFVPPAPHAGGRSLLDFDLSEALRLRGLGWGNRRIARRMNNVSKDTVRRRLEEYDRAIEASKPVVQVVEPIAEARPVPKRAVEPLRPLQPVASPVSHVAPQVIPPGAPESRPTTPEPVSNLEGLSAYWKVRGRQDFQPDFRRFFLVRPNDVQFATGSEQLAMGLDIWRPEFRSLDVFRRAEKMWLVLDAKRDNRTLLETCAADPWMRERALVCRIESGGVLTAFRMRFTLSRLGLGDGDFEQSQRFIPLPAPNCTRELDALLAPAPPREQPQQGLTGYYAPYGGQPIDLIEAYGFERKTLDTGDRSCGVAGTD